ncbi:MAG: substrate-binding domain-containing protein [Bacteroidota bacterium]
MKTTILLFVGILLLIFCKSATSQGVSSNHPSSQKGSITVSCSPELYGLASEWVSVYQGLNPEMKLNVINTTGNTGGLGNDENLSFVSNKSNAAITRETNWKIAVGRDVIVPVMNTGNPLLVEIVRHGVTREAFVQLFGSPLKQNWGVVLQGKMNAPIHIFMVNDESVKSGVASYLKENQLPLNGITFGNRDEVIAAIQKDPSAIGFCKMADLPGMGANGMIENIRLLPIDKNGNGSIDNMEDIYGDLNAFQRGIWIGKYPKSLYTNIYAVSKAQPTDAAELAFLSWVLTDGQKVMELKGYSELVDTESQSQLEKINVASLAELPQESSNSLINWILLTLAAGIALGLIINAIIHNYRKRSVLSTGGSLVQIAGFDENTVLVPKGLYFDKTHTWTFMEKDGTATLGIDDFMQHITGPITRLEMKKPGEKIKRGDLLLSIIQAGKQLKLYAPVSGTITKQNEVLSRDSSSINSSPYGDGWVYVIEPSNWIKEIQLLDMAEKYKLWLNTEFSRVKDFVATTLRPNSLEYSHIVLQDGGLLKDGILSDFGPEVWEEFQSNFLDFYK